MVQCQPLSPSSHPCSENGYCWHNTCICQPNWSSMGDFAIFPGADCDQFIPGIKALAILAIIILPFALLVAFRILYIRTRDGMNFSDPLMQVPTSIPLFIMCNLAFAILKLADPTSYIVGKSVVATTLNSVGTCAMTHAQFTLTTTLSSSFKQYSLMMHTESQYALKEVRKLMNTASILITIGIGFSVAAPFFIIWYPLAVQPLCGIFSAGTGLVVGLKVYCQLRAINIMLPEVERVIERSQSAGGASSSTVRQLEKLSKKLNIQRSLNTRNAPVAIFLYLIFGLWPFLQRKQTYFIMAKIIITFAQSLGMLFLVSPSSTFIPLDQLATFFKRQFGRNASDDSQDSQKSQPFVSSVTPRKISGPVKIHAIDTEIKPSTVEIVARTGCDGDGVGGGDYVTEFIAEGERAKVVVPIELFTKVSTKPSY